MSTKAELACTYAALILADDDVGVTVSSNWPCGTCKTTFCITLCIWLYFQGEKIQTILKAANVDIEPYWPGLFAKALEGVSIKDLITNVGASAGAAPAAAGVAAAEAPAAAAAGGGGKGGDKKEEKKKESEPESDDDMGFGKNSFLIFLNSICLRYSNKFYFLFFLGLFD